MGISEDWFRAYAPAIMKIWDEHRRRQREEFEKRAKNLESILMRRTVKESQNKERNEKVRELYSKGMDDAQIGLKINLTDNRVKQIRGEMGLLENRRKKKST